MTEATENQYRITRRGDGLVNVWLTPGELVAHRELNGRMEYGNRILEVCGINPQDPQWEGDLEEHIRRHYSAWCASAEEVEI